MTRQYIGARYVPIIDGEYNSEKVYEPLTIVTYNGSSYTSKKSVPAGTLPTNTEYWVLTGNYSAQVEEYRQETLGLTENVGTLTENVGTLTENVGTLTENVGTLTENVDTLTDNVEGVTTDYNTLKPYATLVNKKILILGDSISVDSGSWVNAFRSIVEPNGCTVDNISVAGITIANHDSVSGLAATFINRPVQAYDIIILFAGTNDALISVPIGDGGSNMLYFTNAVKALGDKLNASYKDSKVYCVLPLKRNLMDGTDRTHLLNMYRSVLNWYASYYSWTVIDGTQAPRYQLNNSTMRSYYSDGTHPNAAYRPILARFILDAIMSDGTGVGVFINSKTTSINDNNASGTIQYIVDMLGNVTLNVALQIKAAGVKQYQLPAHLLLGFTSAWAADITTNTCIATTYDEASGLFTINPSSSNVNHILALTLHGRMPIMISDNY